MVARLTPDQKAACSNHVGVSSSICFFFYLFLHIQSLIFLARNQNLYLNLINCRKIYKYRNVQACPKFVRQISCTITFDQNFISTSLKISKRCLLLYRVLLFRSSVTGMPPLFGCLFLFCFVLFFLWDKSYSDGGGPDDPFWFFLSPQWHARAISTPKNFIF